MERPRRSMDITKPQRSVARRKGLSRKQWMGIIGGLLVVVGMTLGALWYPHRNDQAIMSDRYQVVYLVTGQIYFGKLQNTNGQYMTLKSAYTVEAGTSSGASAGSVTTPSKILKVSQQVYGPDDSMAIRAEQVQFWQNLQPESKVVKAIESNPQQ